MKTVLNRPDRLVLRDRPWLMAAIIAGGLFIFVAIALNDGLNGAWQDAGKMALVAGLFAIVFMAFVRQQVAILDRPTDQAVVRSATVFGQRETVRPLSQLREVALETETSTDSDGTRVLSRPVLVFADGERVPMNPIYSNGGGARAAQAAVRAWLGNGGRSAAPAGGKGKGKGRRGRKA